MWVGGGGQWLGYAIAHWRDWGTGIGKGWSWVQMPPEHLLSNSKFRCFFTILKYGLYIPIYCASRRKIISSSSSLPMPATSKFCASGPAHLRRASCPCKRAASSPWWATRWRLRRTSWCRTTPPRLGARSVWSDTPAIKAKYILPYVYVCSRLT